jgi:hypothetical protein
MTNEDEADGTQVTVLFLRGDITTHTAHMSHVIQGVFSGSFFLDIRYNSWASS